MYNIMKAQMYQSIRDNGTYYTFLGGIIAFFLFVVGVAEEETNLNELTGSEFLASGSNGMIIVLLALVFTVRICGSDINDKTINNEMLTGIKRSKVYTGRIFVSLFYVMICYVLFVIMPIVILGIINGWGYTIPVKEAVLRLSLEVLPIIRYVLLVACLTFVTMSPLAVVLIGFLLAMGEAFLLLLADELAMPILNRLLPLLTIAELDEIDKYNFVLGYIDGKDVQILGSGMPAKTIAIIAVSAIASALLYYAIGYAVFKKKDMN